MVGPVLLWVSAAPPVLSPSELLPREHSRLPPPPPPPPPPALRVANHNSRSPRNNTQGEREREKNGERERKRNGERDRGRLNQTATAKALSSR